MASTSPVITSGRSSSRFPVPCCSRARRAEDPLPCNLSPRPPAKSQQQGHVLAQPREGTSPLGSPPQPDPTVPREGWAGAGLGSSRAAKGAAACPWRGGPGLERAFAAGEKGSLVTCQEAGEAQSRLCSEGSRRRLWGAGAVHLPARAAPASALLLPPAEHPWGGLSGVSGQPPGTAQPQTSP